MAKGRSMQKEKKKPKQQKPKEKKKRNAVTTAGGGPLRHRFPVLEGPPLPRHA